MCVDTPATILETPATMHQATQLDTLDTLTHMCDTLTQHMCEGIECSMLSGCTSLDTLTRLDALTRYTHTIWYTHTSHKCIKLLCV